MSSKIKVVYGVANRRQIGAKFESANKPNINLLVKELIASESYA